MEGQPGCPGGPRVLVRVLLWGAVWRGSRRRGGQADWLALKVNRLICRGCSGLSQQEEAGTVIPGALRESQPCPHPHLTQGDPCWTNGFQICDIISVCGFKPLNLWTFVTGLLYPPRVVAVSWNDCPQRTDTCQPMETSGTVPSRGTGCCWCSGPGPQPVCC